ncbi:TonB-dependent receptor [Derxia lacustris]|uniref:TonB-dependent receptor n=1 Tax=Derxia lacustris TaxID=764842 RepID=UPI000A170D76|nr:TonB-dependent receptor [Derxia lacustris]
MPRLRPVAAALAALGLAALPSAVVAQLALDRVEVTGSSLKRSVGSEGVAPVLVIGSEEIARRGQTTVEEVLRSLTLNTGNSFNESYTNSFAPGAGGIALRGLSQKNTLVLLNGRRVAPYGFAQNLQDLFADLNAIPLSAVDRIEVLKDGASAIYGSDAVAGVVNIILKRNVQGGVLAASGGLSSRGDGFESQASLGYGFGSLAADGYNLSLTGSYLHRDELLASRRGLTRTMDYRDRGGFSNWRTAGAYDTDPGTAFAGCGGSIKGSVIPGSDLGRDGTACGYNPAGYLDLMPAADRHQLVANGELRLGGGVTAFGDLLMSHGITQQSYVPANLNGGSVAFDPATGGVRSVSNLLPVGNPGNPFGTPVGISYAFQELGPRGDEIASNFWRLNTGLRGLHAGWDWEAAAAHSSSRVTMRSFNRLDAVALERAIADGSYNFADPALTPAASAALRIDPRRDAVSQLDSAGFKASTEAAQLPAGPLGLALGVDFRREALLDRPDAALRQGRVVGLGSTATDAARNVWAGYGELALPLLRTLEATLAARYDRYSDFGSAFSPKAGLRWQPSETALFRSTLSKGFRAPTLTENAHGGSSTFFTYVVDPHAPDPTAAGGSSPQWADSSVVLTGNPQLKPEKTRTWTLGTVLTLDAATTLSVDYYRLHQSNVVSFDSFGYMLANPDQYPGQIVRDADGRLLSLIVPYRNLVALDTAGVDVQLDRRWRLGSLGQLDWNVSFTQVFDYKTPLAADAPASQLIGRNDNYVALPRNRLNSALSWSREAWSGTLASYYIHGYDQVHNGDESVTRVASNTEFDFTLAYTGVPGLRLQASVHNLFDRMPPWDASQGDLPYDLSVYNARGRYFRAGASYRF